MWIKNRILNKTGLACKIWNDAKPEVLRKRLAQKIQHKTLTNKELNIISKELCNLEKEFSIYWDLLINKD